MVEARRAGVGRRKRVRRLLVNLGLSAGVSFVVLGVLEIVLRIVEPAPAYEQRDNEFQFYEYDETLGWRNKPGASGTLRMPDSKTEVVINSRGLRDAEHELAKPPGVRRIQFYGDSFTWGYGVDAEQRITDVFARELEGSSEDPFEVMNFGTTGYGTDQEYLFFRDAGVAYDPDVVVFLYHNDVVDVCSSEAYTYPRPFFEVHRGKLELTNVPVPRRDLEWTERFELEERLLHRINRAFSGSHVYGLVKRRLLAIEAVRNKVFGVPPYAETLEVIDALLLATDELARANEAKLVIGLIPDKIQVYGNGNTIEIDHLVALGEQNGIPVIDLLPDLRRLAEEGEDLYFRIDDHFSVRGNELVGQLLFRHMKEAGIIDGR